MKTMKAIEINTKGWSRKQIKQAFAKLEELGYKPELQHMKEGYTGGMSISAHSDGYYCGYDAPAIVMRDDLTPTFEELMNFTKEDVQ
jgi:hypothetical protein